MRFLFWGLSVSDDGCALCDMWQAQATQRSIERDDVTEACAYWREEFRKSDLERIAWKKKLDAVREWAAEIQKMRGGIITKQFIQGALLTILNCEP